MNTFQKTALTTLIATLLLIAVGSLVRVSGAGLGCPDWPKCWGCWFPPSGVEEIDPNYLKEKGISIEDFNPTKMWIEYINRLVGVTIGLLVLTTFFRALPYRQNQPRIFWGALLSVFLVGFSGWLGGQVVQSGLKPGMITLHMVSAMMLLCVLLYITFLAVRGKPITTLPPLIHQRLIHLSTLLFGVIALQMLLGTQVREAVDPYIKNAAGMDRSAWMASIGWIDHIHRSFTWHQHRPHRCPSIIWHCVGLWWIATHLSGLAPLYLRVAPEHHLCTRAHVSPAHQRSNIRRRESKVLKACMNQNTKIFN
jgi:heme a synthase